VCLRHNHRRVQLPEVDETSSDSGFVAAYLTRNITDYAREIVILPLAVFHPWCEVPHLTIIAVVSQPHLRTDEKDLATVKNDATIVDNILMDHGPAKIVVCERAPQRRCLQ